MTRSDFASGVIGAVRLDINPPIGPIASRPWCGSPQRQYIADRARIFLDRSLTLRVDVREAGGIVEVAPAAWFSERQINVYRTSFDVPCRSKGVLEKALLDAI